MDYRYLNGSRPNGLPIQLQIPVQPGPSPSDLATMLDIKNSPQAVSTLDDNEKSTVVISDGTPGNPNKTVVNEPGLYNLVFKSIKPQAKAFKRWVVHEVLPKIRKTGSYNSLTMDQAIDQNQALHRYGHFVLQMDFRPPVATVERLPWVLYH